MSQPLPNPVSNQIVQNSYSENQSRSHTLQHVLPNDILFDLTPSKTLEALTSSSSRLSKSIESISPSERAFGIRAAVASKKIYEWVEELSLWQWPKKGGSTVFGTISAKHKGLNTDQEKFYNLMVPKNGHSHNYADCLADLDINHYENRLDEIRNDMQDLRVDEIKRQVLDTNIIARTRPSSSSFSSPMSTFFSSTSYTQMDDFTAIVIATVLQALLKLSRLVSLMETWSRRLFILRKIPTLLLALEDAETALASGWNTVQKLEISENTENGKDFDALSRKTFDIMKHVLEEKVTTLGQSLDFMLNIFEGSQDTLPDSWLDRMDRIEKEYGEWVVTCDSIVRRGELLKSHKSHNVFRSSVGREEENDIATSKSGSESHRESNCTQDYFTVAVEFVKSKTYSENLGLTNQKGSAQVESACALSKLTLEEEPQGSSITSFARSESNEKIKVGNCTTSSKMCKKHTLHSSLEPETEECDLTQKSSSVKKKKSIVITDDYLLKSPKSKQVLNLENNSSIIDEQRLYQKSAELSSENDAASTFLKFNKDLHNETRSENPKNNLSDANNQNQHCQAVSEKSKLDYRSVSYCNQSLFNSTKPGQSFCLPSKSSRLDLKVDVFPFSDGTDKCQIYPITYSADEFNTGEFDLDRIKEQKFMRLNAIKLHSESLSRNILRRDIFDRQKIHESEVGSTLKNNIVMPEGPIPRSSSLNSSDSSSTSLSYDLQLDEKYDIVPSAIVNLTSPILEYINDPPLELENLVPTPVRFTENERIHFSDSSVSYFDGCSESRFVNGVDTNDDNLKISKIASCPIQNQGPRCRLLPHVNLNQPETTKFHGLNISEDSIDDSMDINLELVDSSPITLSIPTSKIFFEGEAGKNYSIELPFDGTTIYTNNPLPVSTICSELNVSVFCDITSKGLTPSLILGSSRVFKIVPPQIIFSITYRALTSSVLKAENPRLEFDPLLKIKTNKTSSFTRCIREDTTKETPHILTSFQNGQILNRSEISPVMEEEIKFPPQLPEASVACNDSNIYLRHNHKIPLSSPAHKSASTLSHKSPYLSIHQNSTSSNFAKVIVESSVDSPPSYKNSPIIENSMARKLFPTGRQSPSNGEAKNLRKNYRNLSPPESPLMNNQKPRSTSFGPESSKPPKNRINPSLQHCKTSPTSKVNTSDGAQGIKDDQFQQQISSLLETIPSLVCLSTESEPKILGPEILRSRETRQSTSNHNRSSSSQSNHGPFQRESTPPFTLIPAHGKGMSRQRHQNSNSEIRIYHLSRSNGEAPIKLFVRLVGEHGERVMVRVGGGWADLGEYLREYASHHCRRTDTDTIKIQDTPSRKSSMGTLKSSSTNRETKSSSPLQRPQSVIGESQRYSLRVQKTRRSTGITSAECLVKQSRAGTNSRCPSTPLPVIKHNSNNTPPSATSSSGTIASISAAGTSDKSLRLSWTEEEFNLGLAGPRSKKSFISDRDQEWVECMQEKVRLASAEKDKRSRGRTGKLDKQRARGLSLDGMERIGSTIRLFRRDGSAA